MKINKRKCRAFADPGFKMQSHSGILHAPQIDYIIRAAIKIIDHHKTLLLYVYPRQQAVQGDFSPLWTVFQSRDDYATLERQENGGFKWRKAAFKCLGSGYGFHEKCAFYSFQDERRVIRYFKAETNGIRALFNAQEVILEQRRRNRQMTKERKIIDCMASVHALPRGLKSWIHKSVMPAYFFYDYKHGGKNVPGTCSACGHEIQLSGVKQGKKAFCPHCRHELIMKPRSRRGHCMTDRETCQVIQNTQDGGLVIRIIKAYYMYQGDVPEIQVYENARQFIRLDSENIECYYHQHNSGILTDWKKGDRPVYDQWSYNFEADTCGHVYDKNLPAVLQGTPWQYCPISAFYDHFKEPMQTVTFLRAYLRHPRLEHMVKIGFYNIASDLAYGYHDQESLDETQDRTHRILKVSAEDVQFLLGLGVDISVLKVFQQYAGLKDRQRLLVWQLEHDVERDILPVLEYMTIHKFIRYMDSQYASLRSKRTHQGGLRYKDMQDVISEYRDYLRLGQKLGYDMKNSFVLYPQDLQAAHDKTACQFEQKKAALLKREFIAVYKDISGELDFERDGMKIVVPSLPDEVIAEGHALHHCVGSYVERVADHECIILFLRRCAAEDQSFYTIEVRDNKAVQVRGMQNCAMTPEVEAFITAWERCVLRTRLPAA